jgi:hypothetical protein
MSYNATASNMIMISNEILRKVNIGGREYNLSHTKL